MEVAEGQGVSEVPQPEGQEGEQKALLKEKLSAHLCKHFPGNSAHAGQALRLRCGPSRPGLGLARSGSVPLPPQQG